MISDYYGVALISKTSTGLHCMCVYTRTAYKMSMKMGL